MKNLENSIRKIVVASLISLSFVAPVLAQQEISPDRFEDVAIQSQKVQNGQKMGLKSSKKQTVKVRQASPSGRQSESAKTSAAYRQLARK